MCYFLVHVPYDELRDYGIRNRGVMHKNISLVGQDIRMDRESGSQVQEGKHHRPAQHHEHHPNQEGREIESLGNSPADAKDPRVLA